MRLFGLTPDSVLARAHDTAIDPARAPSLAFSVGFAALGFAGISVVAYSIWAYKLIDGTAPMYGSIAAIYIGLAGLVLSQLVLGPGATLRFAMLFAAAFLVYAIGWCAFWFGLRGKNHADLWGAAAGLAAMAFLLCRAFGKRDGFLPLFGVLFTFHCLGYYFGDALHATVRGSLGRLLWGAAHGLGFGAGLGYLLFHAQAPLKTRLRIA